MSIEKKRSARGDCRLINFVRFDHQPIIPMPDDRALAARLIHYDVRNLTVGTLDYHHTG